MAESKTLKTGDYRGRLPKKDEKTKSILQKTQKCGLFSVQIKFLTT